MKKKAEEEAKQQRKQEREEKKKKAEEEKVRKAEERQRKLAEKAENARKVAEEKAEKAKKVAETKAHRLAEKECRLAEKARRAEEQKATQIIDETSNVTTSNDFLDGEATMQRSGRKRNTGSQSSAAKRKYMGETETSNTSKSQYCVCFEMHDLLQGDWVQ